MTRALLALICCLLPHGPAMPRLASAQAGRHRARPSDVRVPFRLVDNAIVVEVTVGQQRLSCKVDTGCDVPLLAVGRALPGHRTGRSVVGTTLDGRSVVEHEIVVPVVRLGARVVKNVRAWFIAGVGPEATDPMAGSPRVLLGNAFFAQGVVTIDYRARELVLRDASYDVGAQALAPGDLLCSFEPVASGVPGAVGPPVLRGLVSGRAGGVLLDTGCNTSEVLAVAEADRAGAAMPSVRGSGESIDVPGGTARLLGRLPSLAFRLGVQPGLPTYVRRALLIPQAYPNVDLICGWSVVSGYRITIDYPRRRVLLEARQTSHSVTVIANGAAYDIPAGVSFRVSADGVIRLAPQ